MTTTYVAWLNGSEIVAEGEWATVQTAIRNRLSQELAEAPEESHTALAIEINRYDE